eukprot:scaffold201957_cov67-Attheya_sp.AAC.1
MEQKETTDVLREAHSIVLPVHQTPLHMARQEQFSAYKTKVESVFESKGSSSHKEYVLKMPCTVPNPFMGSMVSE